MTHPFETGFTHPHDAGLEHNHLWASDRTGSDRSRFPLAADTAALTTPSCALHDDAHYA